MPIYELHCNGCGKDFETLTRVDELETPCINCGLTDTYRYISRTTHRHADHSMKHMMGAMHKSQERDQFKKELKTEVL